MRQGLLQIVVGMCSLVFVARSVAEEAHVVVVSIDGLAAFLLDDPKAPLPTVRGLAASGCVAVGGMTVSNPSVTWPNHTTLITGVHPERHGVLANGVLVNGVLVNGGPGVPIVVDPRRDQRDLVRAPTIVDAAHAAGIRERTTVFVVSDHGFVTTPKAVRPDVLPRQRGLLTVEGNRITEARVHVYPEGGIGLICVTNPGEAADLRGTIRELFVGQEGVADVLLPEQFAEHGLPHPRRYEQAPDAILVAREGYAVSGGATGDTFVASHTEAGASLGSHGFLATLPSMNATCVVAGRGIRAGGRLEGVRNVDVAPTVAALLGIDGFAADGRVLREALED